MRRNPVLLAYSPSKNRLRELIPTARRPNLYSTNKRLHQDN
jgi:hypothetical protein